MITVEKVEKSYIRCQSCYVINGENREEEILEVSVKLDGMNSNSSMRLCRKCLADINIKAKNC